MQDRYVGNIRDFVKYGLLRQLCPPGDSGSIRLGVVWYRVRPGEVGRGGGGIDCCLQPEESECREHAFCDALRACDDDLAAKLRAIRVGESRSVCDVADAGVLSGDTVFFEEFWTLDGHGRRPEAGEMRRDVHPRALATVDDCGIVFLDPDDGIDPDGRRTTTLPEKLKRVLWGEARAFHAGGRRTVVLMQFLRPWPPWERPVLDRRRNLAAACGMEDTRRVRTLLFCFRRCSGGARPNPMNGPPLVFFIVPGGEHGGLIDSRLASLTGDDGWGGFVSPGGGRRPAGMSEDLCRGCRACKV